MTLSAVGDKWCISEIKVGDFLYCNHALYQGASLEEIPNRHITGVMISKVRMQIIEFLAVYPSLLYPLHTVFIKSRFFDE